MGIFKNDLLILWGSPAAAVFVGLRPRFEIDCDSNLIEGENACDYGYEFKSIIGTGKIIFLETNDEKTNGLNYIMKHQTGKNTEYCFSENELENVCVYKMVVEECTGKQKVLMKN